MEQVNAIQLKNITKTFGHVVANDNINLEVRRGEILSLLGENGSGKTTLMNMLSGIYFPDGGEIFVNGAAVTIRSPKDAFDLGIGMIHQHFKLVDVLTAAENIVLGLNEGRLNRKEVAAKVRAISEKYGFDIDPNQKIYDMSVSQKQTVEIVKVLYRGADILILDEPTAVLTPQETEKLFGILRNMRDDGKAIIIITHKLHEVMAISNRVSVLRGGKYIGTVNTAETTPQDLTNMMVGQTVTLHIDRPEPVDPTERLIVKNINFVDKEGIVRLNNVSFTAYGGEILGIAGIAGSGQKELLEGIAGLETITGEITYLPKDGKPMSLIGKSPLAIRRAGIELSFVPEDRLGMGLVGSMDMTDNVMLKNYWQNNHFFVDRKTPRHFAEELIEQLQVKTPGVSTPVSRLSGGNVQKILVGREISAGPTVLMSAYAVRGLDINTSYTIYDLFNQQKANGVAVIFVGEDLDVLLELCDRILVLCGGKVSGIVDARSVTKEQIGYMMTHVEQEAEG